MPTGNYIEPTVAQKREIRKLLEKVDIKEFLEGRKIVPTDLAEKVLLYCYGIDENGFYSLPESKIIELFSQAFYNLFVKIEEQKKS